LLSYPLNKLFLFRAYSDIIALAACKPFYPFRFYQLSDIQIGFGLDGCQNDTYRMGLAAKQVNEERFDFCIAVGDLTNDRVIPRLQST
jgi:hypothetical protein